MKTKNILSAISTNELKRLSSSTKVKNIDEEKNNFFINYIKPKLEEQNIEINPKINYYEKLEEYNSLGMILFEKYNKKNIVMKIIYAFLSFCNEKKNKELIDIELTEEQKDFFANEICNFIKTTNEIELKSAEFMKAYIIPKLNELAKKGTIIFDKKSNDDRIKLITSNTEKKFLKNIKIKAVPNLYKGMLNSDDKDFFESINFVFNDNIELKKEATEGMINNFIKIYDNLNLEKKD